ncbi:DUF5677 domain-containing protein [Acinetobacter higginsii]|uniref:DUF5677 domain-containing protein n=1 Tax=Acinetobacter higginsii TaxID=70347 RepID=UPI001F4ADD08|nr:DUF5677 domain-containing protein [Acinetobacter higginsii]MCH7340307.1 DUF5677 domain-containing protein [Acinetobacter higginsii]
MPNTNYFELLEEQKSSAEELSAQTNAKGLLGQEILRFTSIAGTLLKSSFRLDKTSSIDERYFTHPLIRSLLENFFKIIYIFDTSELESQRFEQAVNSFKEEYRKLFKDLSKEAWNSKFMDEYRDKLNPAKDEWNNLQKLINPNDFLLQLNNIDGENLQYLYVLYRITSFDIHGNSLKVFFDSSFNSHSSFVILDIRKTLNVIASEYLGLLKKINN